MNVDALITSVGDPQLDRCLDAVEYQTIPFSNIVHMDKVCPMSIAVNTGLRQTKEEWVMIIGGDMIIHKNALLRIIPYIEENGHSKMSGYYFGLYDTFLDCKIGYISVLRGSLYRNLTFEDNYICDWQLLRKLRKSGWTDKKSINFIVGTHFDQPDEFQVFRRCYIHGVRFRDHRSLKGRLSDLLNKTKNPLYRVGIDAIEYAWVKDFYPGSHNYEFDRENYEEWKKLRSQSS